MYSYEYDSETGGIVLNSTPLTFSKEPRPVYYKELDILGFDKHWNYAKDDSAPYLWAEANNYFYRGRLVAKTKGGSYSQAPELVLVEPPEPNNAPLRFIDIPAMCNKNRDIMEKLAANTLKKIYNTYVEYREKVDIFHVSYSGGKDSEVTLDLVARAIPHSHFVVLWGNTGMEFPDTHIAVEKVKADCASNGIAFYEARSIRDPSETWNVFGPPSNTIRWCCSVHKTAPQILKLREILGKSKFTEMAFVGVRADESVRRSTYSYISYSTKHQGQYSCNPILDWNSAEVFLYLYCYGLQINEAYKKGHSRVGCLICPMSAEKSDYMRCYCYPSETQMFLDIVSAVSTRELETKDDTQRYIERGGWKLRNNGRDIKTVEEKLSEKIVGDSTILSITNPNTDWKTWGKTVGNILSNGDHFTLERNHIITNFAIRQRDNGFDVEIDRTSSPEVLKLNKLLKIVFRKAAYCVLCRECESNCPNGFIQMKDGQLQIQDSCMRCGKCHSIEEGCLLYHSVILPKGTGKMNTASLDHYADHAPKPEWIKEFFSKENDFFTNNLLGSMMISMFKRFLRDAELIDNNKLTDFAYSVKRIGLENDYAWGLMLVNLAHTSEFTWYLKNIEKGRRYSRTEIADMLMRDGVKDRGAKSISGAYKRILALPFGIELGMGEVSKEGKETYYLRSSWKTPEPLVILYSLYKFAEACGSYYQFTLTRLLNHGIEANGVSPTEIFGLSREVMEQILTGLTVNHPDFINASFTLGLDNITLDSSKTSKDVLSLF